MFDALSAVLASGGEIRTIGASVKWAKNKQKMLPPKHGTEGQKGAKNERAAAERAAAERWSLSAREKNIVARLSGKPQIYMDEEIKGQMNIFDYGA